MVATLDARSFTDNFFTWYTLRCDYGDEMGHYGRAEAVITARRRGLEDLS